MFEAKYPAAVEKDRDVLLAIYDFPAEHWIHIRTTNPIESTFATVRLRHRKTKGSRTNSSESPVETRSGTRVFRR